MKHHGKLASRCAHCEFQCDHERVHVTILNRNLRHIWVSESKSGITHEWLGRKLQNTASDDDRDLAIRMTERAMKTSRTSLFLARDSSQHMWWLVETSPAAGVGEHVGVIVRASPVCKGFFLLSESQRQVLALIATGHSPGRAAISLGISPNTARTHISRAKQKLGLLDSSELLRWCIAHATVLSRYNGSQILH